jgi:hypothetical protein
MTDRLLDVADELRDAREKLQVLLEDAESASPEAEKEGTAHA